MSDPEDLSDVVDVVVPIVFVTVGLVLGTAGWHVSAGAARRRSWPATEGIVTGASYGRKNMVYLRVRYVAPDGRTREFRNRFGSSLTSDKPGRTVLVRVNPDDPADAVVAGYLSGGGCLGIVFVLFGTVGTLAGIGTALSWFR